ncbi:MAG TPA: alanine racemase [Thermoanaerobaculia bacterium]|nr:alanine racemase [Thermoanaerobaculia bacterium]
MSTASDALAASRPTWAEIDLRAFDRNVAAVAARLPEGSRLVAVLKADAYGHGAVALARRCEKANVAMLATALLEEALELRHAGITLPILVLGPMNEEQIHRAIEMDITIGVPGPEVLETVCAVAQHRNVAIHLKLDTGMGRMGVIEPELPRVVEMIQATPRLKVEAIYTHFANADDPRDPFTREQSARFATLITTLREAGLDAPLHHLANSAATMRGIITPGDFVRVGLALYGAEAVNGGEKLEPVMRWRTAIARLKELPPGHAIGYGTTFHTTRTSRIATLPVGYADGYDRGFSNSGEVLVRGQRVPVVGRVSMDLVTIDVTDIPDADIGDEVVLLGGDITVEELAAKLDTISYEVFCNVSARVPRVYVDGENVVAVRSRFDA